ncbi:MAG TPA: hypothetical protein VGR70_18575 [Stellaceae bacterium]|nr:hypothetical protein [Stellaceae bacterium]
MAIGADCKKPGSAQRFASRTADQLPPLDAFDFRPNFPEYVAPHPLLSQVALEIIGVQRLADNDLRPTELIGFCRFLQGAQLPRQFCDFLPEKIGNIFSYGIQTLKPRHLILQKTDPNFPVRAVLRARTDRANSHLWLLRVAAAISTPFALKNF